MSTIVGLGHTAPRADEHPLDEQHRTSRLAIIAVIAALVWIAGILMPASVIRFPQPIPYPIPIARILGLDWGGFLRFVAVFLLLWGCYWAAIAVSRGLSRARAKRIAAGGTAIFSIIGVFSHPGGSLDIWHYVAEERIFWLHSLNPYATPPILLRDTDPIISLLPDGIVIPSFYGPLWHILAMPAQVLTGNNLLATIIAFKLLAAVLLLLGLPLVFRIAERIRPGTGVSAMIVYGWNPLMLWCTTVDGHNDIAMMLFTLVAIEALCARRWWATAPALLMAGMVKFVVLGLLPLVAIYVHRRGGWQGTKSMGAGVFAGCVGGLLIALPFVRGFGPISTAGASPVPHAMNSLAAIVLYRLSDSDTLLAAPTWFLGISALVAVAVLAVVTLRVARGTEISLERLLTGAIVLLMTVIALTSWFMPWYLTWVVPLAAVVGRRVVSTVALAWSASAMAILIPWGWWPLIQSVTGWRFFEYQVLVVVLLLVPPLCLLIAQTIVTRPATSATASTQSPLDN